MRRRGILCSRDSCLSPAPYGEAKINFLHICLIKNINAQNSFFQISIYLNCLMMLNDLPLLLPELLHFQILLKENLTTKHFPSPSFHLLTLSHSLSLSLCPLLRSDSKAAITQLKSAGIKVTNSLNMLPSRDLCLPCACL